MAETEIKSINGKPIADTTARQNKADKTGWDANKYIGTDANGNLVTKDPPQSGIAQENDPTVPAWAKQSEKPSYTADEVGALPASTKIPAKTSEITNDSGYITIAVATLLNYYLKTETYAKTETYSQTEVDNLIFGLDKRLNAIADSEDVDLDQLSEIVAYIKSNKSLIDAITTSKVNVSDIVDNLTTADSKKPLSAAQGKALKAMYDALPAWAKAASKPTYTKSEVGLGNVDNVRQYSASNPPPYPVTSVNGQTGAVTVTAAGIGAAATGRVEELSEAIADNKIPYIVGDSTTAGTWTGTYEGITEYRDGLTVLYKTNIAGISGGTTLNINGLGAISVHRNASTAVTTTYPVGTVLMLTYSGGAWLTADYDANAKTTAGTSNKASEKMYIVGATSQTSSGTTTYTNKNVYIGTDNCLYSNGEKVVTASENADKLSINQGAANVGKILVVGTDGNLTLTDMPEGGASGDVTGVLDDSKNILLAGNLADGTYTLKWKVVDENGEVSYVDAGALEVSSIVTYTVTQNLTNATSDNSVAEVRKGESITVNLTANSGYNLKSITVTMGGADITSTAVSGGKVTIASVTGDVVITAVAEEIKVIEPVTVDIALTNGIRIGSDGTDRTLAGYCATEYIDLTNIPKPCTIHLTKAKWTYGTSSETGTIMFYAWKADDSKLVSGYTNDTVGSGHFTLVRNEGKNTDVTVTVTSNEVAKIRFSGHWANGEVSTDWGLDKWDSVMQAEATLTYTPAS